MTNCDKCGKEVGNLFCGHCRAEIQKRHNLIPLLYFDKLSKGYRAGCKSCKTCGSYDNDHNRAVVTEQCPWCHWKAKTITIKMYIHSLFHCSSYKFRDWSLEKEWDNQTENWKLGDERPK